MVSIDVALASKSMKRNMFDTDNNIEVDSNNTNDEFSTPVKSTPIKTLLLSKTPYAADNVYRLKLLDSVIECIVKLNLPLSIVYEEPFSKMLSTANNKFRLPCRQTVTKRIIPDKAKQAKSDLQDLLDCIKYCSFTCDGWTSEGSDPYLGIFSTDLFHVFYAHKY